LYRCSVCKSLFLNTPPSNVQLENYYKKKFSYTDGLLNELPIRKRSEIILNTLRTMTPTATSICDVGSGYGYFLDEASKRGYRAEGVEPSKRLALHAKNMYSLPVYNGGLKEYIHKKHPQFDIVTCIHVIEHVMNPKSFISLLVRLVKPGGMLYLETPNSDSHLLYAEQSDYTFLIPPDHLWLLSKESIKIILPVNTRIHSINTYSYPEHVMGIFKKLIKIVNKSNRRIYVPTHIKTNNIRAKKTISLRKKLSYYFFDKGIAPLFTGMLNLYHKGSILELYIKKKEGKSGL